eukprot:TRINITY_DN22221_c0_g1_i1.p1 TRINITY_DN22221_c0_g1~~TRINITY_DN22221_c0_g1_i1.p1  ORF type:complete len:254 (+),score=49.17 TRINITY_DN22221_c0_g1_i1:206-967(+)
MQLVCGLRVPAAEVWLCVLLMLALLGTSLPLVGEIPRKQAFVARFFVTIVAVLGGASANCLLACCLSTGHVAAARACMVVGMLPPFVYSLVCLVVECWVIEEVREGTIDFSDSHKTKVSVGQLLRCSLAPGKVAYVPQKMSKAMLLFLNSGVSIAVNGFGVVGFAPILWTRVHPGCISQDAAHELAVWGIVSVIGGALSMFELTVALRSGRTGGLTISAIVLLVAILSPFAHFFDESGVALPVAVTFDTCWSS